MPTVITFLPKYLTNSTIIRSSRFSTSLTAAHFNIKITFSTYGLGSKAHRTITYNIFGIGSVPAKEHQ